MIFHRIHYYKKIIMNKKDNNNLKNTYGNMSIYRACEDWFEGVITSAGFCSSYTEIKSRRFGMTLSIPYDPRWKNPHFHHGGPIKSPLKPLNTIVLWWCTRGFMVCPQLGAHDCRETPGPRTAIRLIAVVFIAWARLNFFPSFRPRDSSFSA